MTLSTGTCDPLIATLLRAALHSRYAPAMRHCVARAPSPLGGAATL